MLTLSTEDDFYERSVLKQIKVYVYRKVNIRAIYSKV